MVPGLHNALAETTILVAMFSPSFIYLARHLFVQAGLSRHFYLTDPKSFCRLTLAGATPVKNSQREDGAAQQSLE